MSEWKEYKLGEIANIQTGPFGSQLHQSDYVDVGIPSIMPVNIGDRMNISTEKIVYITEEDATRLSRYRVQEGDIVYSRRGDVEKCAYIGKAEIGWLCGTGCLRIRIDSSKADSKFIAYYLSTEDMKSWISNNAVGTTMPNLNSSILQQVPLSMPSLDEQKRIASILSSLDEKIDLLNRENATLEAMAETLYGQWFVKEAKDEWEERKLGDFFDVKTGKKDANYSVENGAFPFFTCSKQTLLAPSYSFEGSAILLAGNGDFNVKRYVGKFEAYQRTYVLIPYNVKYFNFLFIVMKHYLDEITGGHRGSVINFITKGMITDFPVTLPMEDIDDKLKHFDVIFEKVDSNSAQIQTLIQARDGLLPKLLSNEITI